MTYGTSLVCGSFFIVAFSAILVEGGDLKSPIDTITIISPVGNFSLPSPSGNFTIPLLPEPNETLTAEITSNATQGAAPATFEFEGSITGGTGPYTINWNFGDGSREESDDDEVETLVHTFDEAGRYNVILTAIDSEDQTASDSLEITVEEDRIAPTIALQQSGIANITSVNGAQVTYIVTAQDDVDGTATLEEDGSTIIQDDIGGGITISCNPSSGSLFTVDGNNSPTTIQCSATDAARNTGTELFAITVNLPQIPDITPPAIEANVQGFLGNNGWYNTDVTINWTVTDPESLMTSKSESCDQTATINQDTTISGETLTCEATSEGGKATESVTIKRDVTPPAITSMQEGQTFLLNEQVPPDFDCIDQASGIDRCEADVSFLDTSSAGPHSFSVTAADRAGNNHSESFSITVNLPPVTDMTPPVIEESHQGTIGSNDWYTTDIAVSWTVTDEESAVTSQNGCDPIVITQDTIGTELTCEARSAGGTSNKSITINRDAKAPVITSFKSSLGSGGPFELGEVPADDSSCQAVDQTSGIDGQGCIVSGYSTELGKHTMTASARDNAGNGAYQTLTYEVIEPIDNTLPVIEPNIDGTLGNNGWYRGNVQVSWTVTDEESAVTSQNGCDPIVITQDTIGTELTCEARSAGGTSSESVTIRRDSTRPVITDIISDISDGDVFAVEGGVPSQPTCVASDDVSGIDGGCNVSGYSTQVGSHTIEFTATDNAGNEASPEELSYQVVVG